MTIFRRPRLARPAGWALQRLAALGESTADQWFRSRLPEFAIGRTLLSIPTTFGAARAWIYRPRDDGSDDRPVHLNLHGGGFVLGLPQQDDALCRALCALTGSVIVNADYVLAPQRPFPAAVEQAYEIAIWVAGPGAAYGWDGSRLTIGGQSAGGSLAGAVARLALEQGGPSIALQVLHYPPLDLTIPVAEKVSTIDKPLLRPWLSDLFDSCYLSERDHASDRLVSPAAATDDADLTGIAPAMIIAAEHDILRAEAERYAARLDQVDALAELMIIRDRDHAYDQADDEAARATYATIAAHLNRVAQAGDSQRLSTSST